MSEPVLCAREVSRSYGRSWAVRRVTVELGAGTLTALVGDNGAGKSTLLQMFAGLLRPSEGAIEVFGEAFRGFFPSDVRARVGYIGHAPFVYPDLTGSENIAFFSRLYPLGGQGPRPAPDELLAQVGLADAGDKLVRSYSRGMTQRLALARLILQDPPIWLLDEPSTGLDRGGIAFLGGVLAAAKARGRCVVAVTHDMDALGVIDHEVRLKGGRIQA